MSESPWCLIESDPAIFTELLQKFGANGVSIEELISLDAAALNGYKNVHGLILLHKWKGGKKTLERASTRPRGESSVYFARQVVENACATLALVNLLGNCRGLRLGEELKFFFEFTEQLDPFLRGTQVAEYEHFRSIHNSFASPYSADEKKSSPASEGDAFHFVSYVYKDGFVWELDGLQEAPIPLVEATEETYLSAFINAVDSRIAELNEAGSSDDITYALMAVVDDPIIQIQEKIQALQDEGKGTTYFEELLEERMQKRENDRIENVRRRHNYVPMVLELLKGLAEKGVLEDLMAEVSEDISEQ